MQLADIALLFALADALRHSSTCAWQREKACLRDQSSSAPLPLQVPAWCSLAGTRPPGHLHPIDQAPGLTGQGCGFSLEHPLGVTAQEHLALLWTVFIFSSPHGPSKPFAPLCTLGSVPLGWSWVKGDGGGGCLQGLTPPSPPCHLLFLGPGCSLLAWKISLTCTWPRSWRGRSRLPLYRK